MSSQSSFAQKNCGICWNSLTQGQGQAIFTSECSHSFHYPCIANNVKNGNLSCPICLSKWDKNNVPFQVPPLHQTTSGAHGFADDEPLPSSSPTPQSFTSHNVAIKTHTETNAVPAAESHRNYPVLVSICAPALQDPEGEARTPIDLVTVLDVSSSMTGRKLELVKKAMKFVVENMGSLDRLSIVSFSTDARRVLPLKRMNLEGRRSAIEAVESLVAYGGTYIAKGLSKASHILEDRRERNPVGSIILLSDGQDNYCTKPSQMVKKLPYSLRASDMEREIPVHTFGFGNDHDANIMHAISEESKGTFSYIESVGMIQDGFALCIGGLLSVVVQELRLTVRATSNGVKIVSLPSGGHVSRISDNGIEALVEIGNMYAEETKQFLVNLSIPETLASDTKMTLLEGLCVYKDLALNEFITLEIEKVEISRPEVCSPAEMAVSLEIDRQRNRLLVADAIGEAQRLAEMGNLEGAREILEQGRETLLASAAAKAGDDISNMFETELKEIMTKMQSMSLYKETGRAYAHAAMSAHARQRASARGNAENSILNYKAGAVCFSAGPSRFRGGASFGGGGCRRGGKKVRMPTIVASAGDSSSEEECDAMGAWDAEEDEDDDDMGFSLCDGDVSFRGAFETPAMVRMVKKSKEEQLNQTTEKA